LRTEDTLLKRFLLLFLLVVGAAAAPAVARHLDVMTYNIRCGSCEKPDDVNHWSRRKFLVAAVVRKQHPDLIGLQEAELFQVRDLAGMLPEYAWLGVGRDDGAEKGEANAILYRTARFELVTHQTLWLSATPERVGKGWDAAYNRTVTVARLRDRRDGREFYLFDTHFDHLGRQARVESSKLVVALVRSLGGGLPAIVTGDFNYTREDAAYRIVADALRDAERISRTRPRGGSLTFNDFGRSLVPGNKIDYVFVNEGFDVRSHRIVADRYRGLYPSDHFAVQARLRMRDAPRQAIQETRPRATRD
jgi:endonuclease/exonuclease/phosphatase family metal-dependent hydrolase